MSRHDIPDELWGTPGRRQIFVSEQSPAAFVAALENRMRPGRLSEAGFLGPSERLLERLRTDDEWLRLRGVTHDQIADRLETMIGVASRSWGLALRDPGQRERGQAFVVYDRFEVEITASCGFQECPFSLGMTPDRTLMWCGEGASNYLIRDRVTGRSLFVPHLAIHLIRDHHFFEGETPYRVEPATVTSLLEIEPGFQYVPRTVGEPVWRMLESTPQIDEGRVAALEKAAESRVEFGGTTAYQIEDELVLVIRETPPTGAMPLVDGMPIEDLWLNVGISRFRRVVETFNVETPWTGTPPRKG